MSLDLLHATHATFEPLVGTDFTMPVSDGELLLRLDNVRLGSEATGRDTPLEIEGQVIPVRRAFTLELSGPVIPLLPQATYTLVHPDCGELLVFLTPHGKDSDRAYYECAFN